MFRKMALVAITASTLMPDSAAAQSLSDVPTVYHLSGGIGSDIATMSAAASRSIYVGTSDRFRAGFNLRATLAVPDGLEMKPFDQAGFGASNETLLVSGSALLMNLGLNASIGLTGRVNVGMNIDLFGFATGPRKAASYHETPTASAVELAARPIGSNIFAGGSGDRGSLNSEFFLEYTLNDRYALRGGMSHQLLAYQVAVDEDILNAAKFRRYSNLLFVGVTMTRPQ